MGNGLASRAIIRKNDIIMHEEETLAGHEIVLLDQ